MLMSAREACAVLAAVGVGRNQAQRVLAAGLAGEPVRTRSAVIYDEQRVRELAARPILPWREVEDLCPAGLFVARRAVAVTRPRAEQLSVLAGGWGAVCPWHWVEMGLQIRTHGSLPFIATVAGFVALGADIVALRGFSELVLEGPGPWFDAFDGSRFPTGPGRPWVLHLGPLRPAKMAA